MQLHKRQPLDNRLYTQQVKRNNLRSSYNAVDNKKVSVVLKNSNEPGRRSRINTINNTIE